MRVEPSMIGVSALIRREKREMNSLHHVRVATRRQLSSNQEADFYQKLN